MMIACKTAKLFAFFHWSTQCGLAMVWSVLKYFIWQWMVGVSILSKTGISTYFSDYATSANNCRTLCRLSNE